MSYRIIWSGKKRYYYVQKHQLVGWTDCVDSSGYIIWGITVGEAETRLHTSLEFYDELDNFVVKEFFL